MTSYAALVTTLLLLSLARPVLAADDITPDKPRRAEGGLLAVPRLAAPAKPAPAAPAARSGPSEGKPSGPSEGKPSGPSEGKPSEAMACGRKHFCREMTSCAEARFYLSRCGLARLDRDGDGIPCETLCP